MSWNERTSLGSLQVCRSSMSSVWLLVDEDCKSPVGQKFEEEYQQKALEAYVGKKLCKRKVCPTATVTVYLDVEGESTSSSMASVESSQRAMASSAAALRTQ
jgi:hypothetical protein